MIKISEEVKNCYKKTITTSKVVKLTAFDEGIPTEGVVQNQP